MRRLLLVGLLLSGVAGAAKLTEAQRYAIWVEMDAADVRAMKLADTMFPISCVPFDQPQPTSATFDANAKINQTKTDLYEAAVMKKYRITAKDMGLIIEEGMKKHWPQIPYSPPGC